MRRTRKQYLVGGVVCLFLAASSGAAGYWWEFERPSPDKVRDALEAGDLSGAQAWLRGLEYNGWEREEIEALREEVGRAERQVAYDEIRQVLDGGQSDYRTAAHVGRLHRWVLAHTDDRQGRSLLLRYYGHGIEACKNDKKVVDGPRRCQMSRLRKMVELDEERYGPKLASFRAAAIAATRREMTTAAHAVKAWELSEEARDLAHDGAQKDEVLPGETSGVLAALEVAAHAHTVASPRLVPGASLDQLRFHFGQRLEHFEKSYSGIHGQQELVAVADPDQDLSLYFWLERRDVRTPRVAAMLAGPSPHTGLLDVEALAQAFRRHAGVEFPPERLELPEDKRGPRPDSGHGLNERKLWAEQTNEKQVTWGDDGAGVVFWRDQPWLAHVGGRVPLGYDGLPREIDYRHHRKLRNKHLRQETVGAVEQRKAQIEERRGGRLHVVSIFLPVHHTPSPSRSTSVRSGSSSSSGRSSGWGSSSSRSGFGSGSFGSGK